MLPENKCQSINLKEKSEMVVKDKVLPFQGWLLPLKAIHSVKLVILSPQQSRTGGLYYWQIIFNVSTICGDST